MIALNVIVSVILFIIAIAIVIITHEFGHYLICKIVGFHVNEVSIGSGKVLFKKQLGSVKFVMRCIPLIGHCAAKELSLEYADEKQSYRRLNAKKMLACAGGIIMNLFLAFSLFFFLGGMLGVTVEHIEGEEHPLRNNTSDYRVTHINGNRVYAISNIELLMYDSDENIITISRAGYSYADVTFDASYVLMLHFTNASIPFRIFNALDYTVFSIRRITDFFHITSQGSKQHTYSVAIGNPFGFNYMDVNLPIRYHVYVFMNTIGTVSILYFFINLLPLAGFDGFGILYTSMVAINNKPLKKITTKILVLLSIVFLIIFYALFIIGLLFP